MQGVITLHHLYNWQSIFHWLLFQEIHHYLSSMVTLFHILKWCFPSLCRPSSLLKFLYIFSTENFIDSLDDAKLATDLQPSFLKAIISGKIKMNVLYVFNVEEYSVSRKSCSVLNSLEVVKVSREVYTARLYIPLVA